METVKSRQPSGWRRVSLLSPFRGWVALETLQCNSPTVKVGVPHGLFITHTASARNLEGKKRKQAQAS